jgi:hypothetical protein
MKKLLFIIFFYPLSMEAQNIKVETTTFTQTFPISTVPQPQKRTFEIGKDTVFVDGMPFPIAIPPKVSKEVTMVFTTDGSFFSFLGVDKKWVRWSLNNSLIWDFK